ncbi:MAG: MoxR family ATPase [Lachnospiraceae bacterium]|nr:MoxR family ATPase [Lachnospiraceae bacterium]
MQLAIIQKLKENIQKVIIGNSTTIDLLLTAILAGGHVLLEDVPGTGKTVLAKSIAKSINGEFGRIQFTPDLLPSDVTGLNYFDAKTSEFVFAKGPAFCSILLADEINRATPKTQSSLLECMAERQITVDGVTHPLPAPFFVIATQNPLETLGTFPLPEAQMDRFLMQLSMEDLSRKQELSMIARFLTDEPLEQLSPVCSAEDLVHLQSECCHVYIHPELSEYLVSIVQASRHHNKISRGVSPRGTLSFLRAVQGYAMVQGREYVVPEDIKALAMPVLGHRMTMTTSAEGRKAADIAISEILNSLELPTENWAGK